MSDDCESIPFEDHRDLLDAAEGRIAELEAENERLRLAIQAHKDSYRNRECAIADGELWATLEDKGDDD